MALADTAMQALMPIFSDAISVDTWYSVALVLCTRFLSGNGDESPQVQQLLVFPLACPNVTRSKVELSLLAIKASTCTELVVFY